MSDDNLLENILPDLNGDDKVDILDMIIYNEIMNDEETEENDNISKKKK